MGEAKKIIKVVELSRDLLQVIPSCDNGKMENLERRLVDSVDKELMHFMLAIAGCMTDAYGVMRSAKEKKRQ